MKKVSILVLLGIILIGIQACSKKEEEGTKSYARDEVTITQNITTGSQLNEGNTAFEGGSIQTVEQTFLTNPSSVAIFSYDALDILDFIGLENTSISTLGIAKSSLPNYLDAFQESEYKNVGTLFLPDFDSLDLFNPDLIIIGGRSTRAYDALKQQYPNTDILDVTFVQGEYIESLENNILNLGKIFTSIQTELDQEIENIKTKINEIHDITNTYDALFILVNGATLSFYGRDGRFAVLYDEFGFIASDDRDDNGQTHGELVGYEYIASINPSIIFLMDRGAAIGNASGVSEVLNNALVNNTQASIDDHIYELDGEAWYLSTGGFSSTYQMIDDLEIFTSKISE
ncbi:MAG: ABC transporter substrate-binding protein [Acholeplasmataceae bacterium]|nr:ABC transporter substrate-binding protein [Acholeplasmataceae bacterium]